VGLALAFCPPECRVVAIDSSPGMLDVARKRARRYGFQHIELLHMDAADMDFEDGSFDTVMAANVDTAITDYRKAVMEMIRVCRPGGRIIMLNHFQR
jgi:phosphatidylethanolamine/phosphatidyl-N-methylethanolamine N-methyltransferase